MNKTCMEHTERITTLEANSKNFEEKLQELCNDVKTIKRNLAFATGFLTAMQFLAPYIIPSIVEAFTK